MIVTDNFNLAPTLYDADKYYITGTISDDNYWDEIDKICEDNNVGLIISLIDQELEHLAKRKDVFSKKGILVNAGDYDCIHACFDKLLLLNYLKQNGFPCIKTYCSVQEVMNAIRKKEVEYPLFAKPRCGYGSRGIFKINNENELTNLSIYDGEYLFQEFIDGVEYGVDVFVDLLSNKICSIFIKKKIKMRAGETDKSVSYKNKELFDIIQKFTYEYGLVGANDIDVFEREGVFYISEVNPRFGGGYIHAYECGENFPCMLINNMEGIVNTPCIGKYKEGVYMMKYFDIRMWEEENSNE